LHFSSSIDRLVVRFLNTVECWLLTAACVMTLSIVGIDRSEFRDHAQLHKTAAGSVLLWKIHRLTVITELQYSRAKPWHKHWKHNSKRSDTGYTYTPACGVQCSLAGIHAGAGAYYYSARMMDFQMVKGTTQLTLTLLPALRPKQLCLLCCRWRSTTGKSCTSAASFHLDVAELNHQRSLLVAIRVSVSSFILMEQ
jgi:hypothetical protein